MKRCSINMVWFKRDLRLTDHLPLKQAASHKLPTLLFYCFEPGLIHHDTTDDRHWTFVADSLRDLENQLSRHELKLYIFYADVKELFFYLLQNYEIVHLFSHQETGVKWTFDRDKWVKKICREHQITWIESVQDGVVRGLKDRTNWSAQMDSFLQAPIEEPELRSIQPFQLNKDFPDKFRAHSFLAKLTSTGSH